MLCRCMRIGKKEEMMNGGVYEEPDSAFALPDVNPWVRKKAEEHGINLPKSRILHNPQTFDTWIAEPIDDIVTEKQWMSTTGRVPIQDVRKDFDLPIITHRDWNHPEFNAVFNTPQKEHDMRSEFIPFRVMVRRHATVGGLEDPASVPKILLEDTIQAKSKQDAEFEAVRQIDKDIPTDELEVLAVPFCP